MNVLMSRQRQVCVTIKSKRNRRSRLIGDAVMKYAFKGL